MRVSAKGFGAVAGLLLVGSPAVFAAGLRQSSGVAIASAPVVGTGVGTMVKSTRGGLIESVTLLCASTVPCEVAIFDVSTASDTGTPVWEGRGAVANDARHFAFEVPIGTSNGINVQVSAGGKAFVTYE